MQCRCSLLCRQSLCTYAWPHYSTRICCLYCNKLTEESRITFRSSCSPCVFLPHPLKTLLGTSVNVSTLYWRRQWNLTSLRQTLQTLQVSTCCWLMPPVVSSTSRRVQITSPQHMHLVTCASILVRILLTWPIEGMAVIVLSLISQVCSEELPEVHSEVLSCKMNG